MPTQTWTDDFHGTDYFETGVYGYNYADGTSAPDPIVDSEVRCPLSPDIGEEFQWIDPRAGFTGSTLVSMSIWAEYVFPFGADGPEVDVGLIQGLYGEADGIVTRSVYCWDDNGGAAFQSFGFTWSAGSGGPENSGRLEMQLLANGTITKIQTPTGGSPTTQTATVPYINDLLGEYVYLFPYVVVHGSVFNAYTAVTSWGYTIETTLPIQSVSTVTPGVGSSGAIRRR